MIWALTNSIPIARTTGSHTGSLARQTRPAGQEEVALGAEGPNLIHIKALAKALQTT